MYQTPEREKRVCDNVAAHKCYAEYVEYWRLIDKWSKRQNCSYYLAHYSFILDRNNLQYVNSLIVLVSDRFWQRPAVDGKDYTQVLISIVKQKRFQSLLKRRLIKKSEVWEKIADEMTRVGAPIPTETREEAALKCHQKWRNLHTRYLNYKRSVQNSDVKKKPPRYFEEIDAEEPLEPIELGRSYSIQCVCTDLIFFKFSDMTKQRRAKS